MEERAIEENIRLAQVIPEANYAEQKIKMEYDRKQSEEKVAKARAKVLNIFGDVSLQDPLLTEEKNRKSKKTRLLRKGLVFHKNETKTED